MKLFDRVETVCDMKHGWCTPTKANALAALVLAIRPDIVVEIGVWSGKSLIPMALAVKENGSGIVIGIDPFSPQASAEGQTGENKAWWDNVANHDFMYSLFVNNCKVYGVDDVVKLYRSKSSDVPVFPLIDILHIDGNHGPQAIDDANRFAPAICLGGYVILDDLHWDGGGVSQAAENLISMGFKELYRVVGSEPDSDLSNDWAVFQKIRHIA